MPLTVFCDESGYTGPNLLDEQQRFFVYSSVALPPELADEIATNLRSNFGINSKELKYENFSQARGKDALRWLLTTYRDRFAVFYADKRFSAAGKFFEYTFEPVLRPIKNIFYEIGFHKFISNLLVASWDDGEIAGRELIEDGQNLIRDKQPTKLKRLLRPPLHLPGGDDPLSSIASFCAAYKRDILKEIAAINANDVTARWTMDISDTALLQIINHWGKDHEEIELICDESKPLQASADHIARMATTNLAVDLGFPISPNRNIVQLNKPIRFVDSKGAFVGVQLADLIGGLTRSVLLRPKSRHSQDFWPLIEDSILPMSIYPQPQFLDVNRSDVFVNLCLLAEFGRRGRANENPIQGMLELIPYLQRNALKNRV